MRESFTTTPEAHEQVVLDHALESAGRRVAELGFDAAFQARLAAERIDIESDDPDRYWGAVASHTEQLLDEEQLSPLERDSLAVAANLPHALLNQYYLDHYQDSMDYRQKRAAKETVCGYNGLLKHYVTAYPQPVDRLHQSLLGVTLETIGTDSADFTAHAEKTLRDVFKGIKHEIGFAQILDTFPEDVISYREASVDEDLKGKDLIVRYKGREIGVDVKASLSEVDVKNRGSNGTPIARKPNGDLVMFSMLLDPDFKGGFQPTPSRVAEIAPAAGILLQRALEESIAKK